MDLRECNYITYLSVLTRQYKTGLTPFMVPDHGKNGNARREGRAFTSARSTYEDYQAGTTAPLKVSSTKAFTLSE